MTVTTQVSPTDMMLRKESRHEALVLFESTYVSPNAVKTEFMATEFRMVNRDFIGSEQKELSRMQETSCVLKPGCCIYVNINQAVHLRT